MNGRQFAEHLGVAHGTVKRWLHEGMPAHRSPRRRLRIEGEWYRGSPAIMDFVASIGRSAA